MLETKRVQFFLTHLTLTVYTVQAYSALDSRQKANISVIGGRLSNQAMGLAWCM